MFNYNPPSHLRQKSIYWSASAHALFKAKVLHITCSWDVGFVVGSLNFGSWVRSKLWWTHWHKKFIPWALWRNGLWTYPRRPHSNLCSEWLSLFSLWISTVPISPYWLTINFTAAYFVSYAQMWQSLHIYCGTWYYFDWRYEKWVIICGYHKEKQSEELITTSWLN